MSTQAGFSTTRGTDEAGNTVRKPDTHGHPERDVKVESNPGDNLPAAKLQ